MTGLDHMFLALDSATTNAVLGGLVKFDQPADGQPVPDASFMRDRLTERLPLIPAMSKRMVKVPLMLDHSYLAHVDRVDVADRIKTVSLPEPGTDVELAAEVSRIMGTPLLTEDVMWDLTVIEGLAGGGIAHLLRIHHAVVDGSTMPTIWDLFSDEPTSDIPETPVVTSLPEPLLGSAEMAARGVAGLASVPLRQVKLAAGLASWAAERWSEDGWTPLPALVGRFLPGPGGRALRSAVNRRQRAHDRPEVIPYIPSFYAPETPINGRISARRHFVLSEMDLEDVKAIGKAAGTTLNNAVVTVCAGAVRRYLHDRGVEPAEPIVVCVPVSLRHEGITDPWANHVHMMFAKFPVHLSDPLERLEYTANELNRAKDSFDGLPTHLIRESSRLLPRDLLSWMTQLWIRLPERWSRAAWNVVVSNVRGPSKPATMNGLRVAGYWPASFLSIGGGINITLQSYVDKICFGFIGAPEQTGDLWPLTQYMQDALQELREAVMPGAGADAESDSGTVLPLENQRPAGKREQATHRPDAEAADSAI
ncbi:MAG: wax ester/triacylglycerol synthase family O-acyltransferase [Propionibacteriaceae bacterium]|nr:wax ester/triacylglycerol synthase family O-acyltransferase [Propionibacteriaceae bacterium]